MASGTPGSSIFGWATLRELAAARRHGLPLRDVALLLADDPEQPAQQREALRRVAAAWQQLPAGDGGWSAAFAATLPQADAATTAWLREAEAAGADAQALRAWSDDVRSQDDARRSGRIARTWPLTIGVCMLLIWLVAVEFLMPAFGDVYREFSAELPEPTLWTLALAEYTRRHLLLMLVGLALLVLVLRHTRRRWQPLVAMGAERLPFVRRLAVARFADRLLLLLGAHAGHARLQAAALGHLAATAPTPAWARCAARLQAAIAGGATPAAALRAEPALPRRLGLHLQLAEARGQAAEALADLREQQAAEGELAAARYERNLLLLVYGGLGFAAWLLVSAIYLPIFKLGSIF